MTPLHMAANCNNVAAVTDLLDAAKTVSETKMMALHDDQGYTPLHHSCYVGAIECIRLLLARGASKEELALDSSRPLHFAARMGHAEAVRLLLLAGAEKAAFGDEGCTPLLEAAAREHVDCVVLLLEFGVSVNQQGRRYVHGLFSVGFVLDKDSHILAVFAAATLHCTQPRTPTTPRCSRCFSSEARTRTRAHTATAT